MQVGNFLDKKKCTRDCGCALCMCNVHAGMHQKSFYHKVHNECLVCKRNKATRS
jgi:hypothetical protein